MGVHGMADESRSTRAKDHTDIYQVVSSVRRDAYAAGSWLPSVVRKLRGETIWASLNRRRSRRFILSPIIQIV